MLRSLRMLAVMTALCVASLLASNPVSASVPCELHTWEYPSAFVTEHFAHNPDGSFHIFAYDIRMDNGRRIKLENGKYLVVSYVGQAVVDVGGGRVGQVVSGLPDAFCPNDERLLFIDCTTSEAILLDGRSRKIPESMERLLMGAGPPTVRQIQPPYGPIGLTKDITVGEVAAIATKHEIGFTRDLEVMSANVIKRMRYNPYQGCKIFYPDSPGAKR